MPGLFVAGFCVMLGVLAAVAVAPTLGAVLLGAFKLVGILLVVGIIVLIVKSARA